MANPVERLRTLVQERGRTTGVELLVNFVAPFLIYDLTQHRLGDVHALMASSIPPIVWSVIEFARRRRIDALSMLVLAGIALSLLAFFGGGGARFLQLREKLVTGLIGLGFVISALIGRPLIFELARASMRRQGSEDLAMFEARRHDPRFKRVMTLMTLVWGFGLLADTAVGCALVMTVSIKQYLIVGPIFGYATMGALALWTFWYARMARRRGEARRAAEAAAADVATG